MSKEILGYVARQTPINEEYVAVKKIEQLLSEGKTEKEIAMIWNGSLGGSEEPKIKKGKNRWGVKYDTLAYSQKVLAVYNQ